MEEVVRVFEGFSRLKMMKAFQSCVFLAALFFAVACGQKTPSDLGAESSAPAELTVRDAKAHLLPGGHGAFYFTVASGTADRLLRVETKAATAAEIHETVNEGGMMRMVAHPEGFEVPAEGELVFEPGGKHVMLLGFEADEGEDSVALTLHFEQVGAVSVDAQLISLAGANSDAHSMDSSSTGEEHHHHGTSAPAEEEETVEEKAAP